MNGKHQTAGYYLRSLFLEGSSKSALLVNEDCKARCSLGAAGSERGLVLGRQYFEAFVAARLELVHRLRMLLLLLDTL